MCYVYNLDIAKYFVEQGIPVLTQMTKWNIKNFEVVKFLISQGCNINTLYLPFYALISKIENVETGKFLFENGLEINKRFFYNISDHFHEGCNLEVFKYFTERFKDELVEYGKGERPFWYTESVEIAKHLLNLILTLLKMIMESICFVMLKVSKWSIIFFLWELISIA